MKTVKTMLCAATALAFFEIPEAPAQAETITVCRAANGIITWPLGQRAGKCRTGEVKFMLERPVGGTKYVSAIATDEQGECAVLAELLGGDIALCVGHDTHIGPIPGEGYGPHCFFWLETVMPLARAGEYGDGARVRLDFDEVSGQPNTKSYTRALITFVDQGAFVTHDPARFMTDDGYVINVENIELLWTTGDDCRAYARTSSRQR